MIKREDVQVRELEWLEKESDQCDLGHEYWICNTPLGEMRIWTHPLYKGDRKFGLAFNGFTVAIYKTLENAKAGAYKRICNIVLSLIKFEE